MIAELSEAAVRAALAPLRSPADSAGDPREVYARVVWSVLTEPGDGVAGALVRSLGAAQALELLDRGALAATEHTSTAVAAATRRWLPRRASVGEALAAAMRSGVRLVTPDCADWPDRLDDLGDHAPLCLWTRGPGALPAADAPTVAIVGARAATSYGEHVAMELAGELAAAGITVVSGAAYGIDGCAHRAALSAGGPTAAILAGGVDRPYPAGHRDLLSRIAQRGTVAAEVPCGSTPTKWRFLSRNRLIAALADAVVIVEAGWRSGSLNTAHHAAALGRPLGAVPGPVTSAASAGCHRLLREADAQCITSTGDVREMLGIDPGASPDAGGRTDDRTRVLDALATRGGRETGDVARRAGLSFEEAGALLALLELEGIAVRAPRGWIRCPAPR